ncbi:MAG: DegT/DnrJ/EryC1/StrS family aminotransferase [Bacteroidia bacterium]|nr:DegT/DnrJ/EryC1/StrS family aminotransferase [Bacteroidia bacterium]
MRKIHMVDLVSQYQGLKKDIDSAMQEVTSTGAFINGPAVNQFALQLAEYLKSNHVIPCANGTDALQIALMALDLPEGSEVITSGFSYIAVAEVCMLLKLKPVFVDADNQTFNIDANLIEAAITSKTKVIAPVHLFGQPCEMEKIMKIASEHNLYVIEDNAQAIGANYTFSDGTVKKAGTIGHIATTSFFPSKNLGCYGDGGAVYTNDKELAAKIKMIANHGQQVKYIHDVVGVNSRLDTLQAAILGVKLKHLDKFIAERQVVAAAYDKAFSGHQNLAIPARQNNATHVFHQYTLKTCAMDIPAFKKYLETKGIPTMVYYPLPVFKQKAFNQSITLPVSEMLCGCVVSLPIGTDMDTEQINYITQTVFSFFEEVNKTLTNNN